MNLFSFFDIHGQPAVITGGSGVLGSVMARALAQAGAKVAILGLHEEKVMVAASAIQSEGNQALGIACDVLDRASLEHVLEQVAETFGPIDILVNAAGGNSPQATTTATQPIFDLDRAAVEQVFGLNFTGTFLACQVFWRGMAEPRQGCIANIGSVIALRPLTRIPAYSAAKAAVPNFTPRLAHHMPKGHRSTT